MKKIIAMITLIMGLQVATFANTCVQNAQFAEVTKANAEKDFALLTDELSKLLEATDGSNIYNIYHDAFYGKCESSSLMKITKALTLQENFKQGLTAIAESSARSYEAFQAGLCSKGEYAASAFYMQVYFSYKEQSEAWTKFIDTILECLKNK